MLLSDILKKDNNNIDLIRIFAAAMVIYGHAYAISPEAGTIDIVRMLIGFDYSGSMAVKVFFFISGLVVSNSLMSKKNISEYIISRFFRIWPAFMTVVIIGYFLSYITTSISKTQFSEEVPFLNYIINSFMLNIRWSFPGVFADNNISTFNGSLWSIVYEVGCYIVLLSVLSITGYRKTIANAICILIVFDSVYGYFSIFKEALLSEEVRYLPAIFAIGVMVSINKEKININIETALLLVLFTSILNGQKSIVYELFFYITLMYSIMYISSNKLFIALKPKYDISYGIYLYGFPVQQFVYLFLKDTGYGLVYNQIISIILSIFLGTLSWILIEKRFIDYGRYFSSKHKKEEFA